MAAIAHGAHQHGERPQQNEIQQHQVQNHENNDGVPSCSVAPYGSGSGGQSLSTSWAGIRGPRPRPECGMAASFWPIMDSGRRNLPAAGSRACTVTSRACTVTTTGSGARRPGLYAPRRPGTAGSAQVRHWMTLNFGTGGRQAQSVQRNLSGWGPRSGTATLKGIRHRAGSRRTSCGYLARRRSSYRSEKIW